MKITATAVLLTTIFASAFLMGQNTPATLLDPIGACQQPGMIGNYEDAKRIVQDKERTNQFVFVRLIYNGRIPGYLKN